MLVIHCIVLFSFVLGIIFCLNKRGQIIETINKKEHKLYFIYPLADWILIGIGMEKLLKRKAGTDELVKTLYTSSKPEQLLRLYWCRRLSFVILVFIIFNVIALLGQFTTNNSIVVDGHYLLRPDYGEGTSKVDLKVTLEKPDEIPEPDEGTSIDTQKVSINVQERSYTSKQLDEVFEQGYKDLQTIVLGRNQSFDKVSSNLNFIDQIPDTSITVNWEPDDYSLIQSDGTVNNEDVSEGGVRTSVTAALSYRKEIREYTMSFLIMPKNFSKEEILQKGLEEEIKTYAQNSESERYLELPNSLENYQLRWDGGDNNNEGVFLLLGVLVSILVWLAADRELVDQMKKRNDQMLMDYPEILNKFSLLVNAGMTLKQAWLKITEDYKGKLLQGIHKRYAYEEMLTTTNELKLGTPEQIAYEQFGRRTGLIPYVKFSTLITQNLKKGTKGFTEQLAREAMDAFEERKQVAKKLGEEAGTKLLLPMMGMLIIVFLIIMIPAFWAFRIQ